MVVNGGPVGNLDVHFHLGVTGKTPLHLLVLYQRRPAKIEDLSNIRFPIKILKMSRVQLKLSHHTKNQENLNLDKKRQSTDANTNIIIVLM